MRTSSISRRRRHRKSAEALSHMMYTCIDCLQETWCSALRRECEEREMNGKKSLPIRDQRHIWKCTGMESFAICQVRTHNSESYETMHPYNKIHEERERERWQKKMRATNEYKNVYRMCAGCKILVFSLFHALFGEQQFETLIQLLVQFGIFHLLHFFHFRPVHCRTSRWASAMAKTSNWNWLHAIPIFIAWLSSFSLFHSFTRFSR